MRAIPRLGLGPWPLAARLTLAMTLLVIAAVVGITVQATRRETQSFRVELEQQAGLLLDTLTVSAVDPLYSLDADFLYDLVLGLTEGKIVLSARVYDRNGRILADPHDRMLGFRTQPDPFGRRLVASTGRIFEWQRDRLLAGRAVSAGRERLGAVSVTLPTAPLAVKVGAMHREGFSAGLIAALGGALLAFLVAQTISRPVEALTRATERVTAGDLGQEVPARTADEFGRLAQAFNSMTARLRESMDNLSRQAEVLRRNEAEVRGLNTQLEERVRDRTSQLADRERELRQATAFLEHLITSSPVVMFQGPPGFGTLTYISPNVQQVLGYTAAEAMAAPEFWLERMHPDHRERLLAERQRVLDAGERWLRYEIPFRREDGGYSWLYFVVRFDVDTAGVPIGVLGYALDIQERKAAEEGAREAREEADRASRAKSEFLSRMSHELRTPLNAILGFAQLLEMDTLSPDQADSVQQILRGGRHLLDLINEVLDITRIEAGQTAVSLEPVLLAEVVEESLDMIMPLAAQRKLQITNATPEAWERYVQADSHRLKQVLLNLLSNAVKYNRPHGAVTLSCQERPDGRVRLSVADTGPGIALDNLDRLFVPFERLGADQVGVEGTGIGLVHSKALVESMAGDIGVESEVGQGSVFWVDLAAAEDPGAGEVVHLAPPPESTRPARSHTVLYIDNNPSNHTLMRRMLDQRPDVRLLTVMQGRLGLDLAQQHRPALILLDLHIEDISGDEVLRRLRGDPTTARVPVVVISADSTPGQADRLLALGAHAYLSKPVDLKQLLAVLGEALQERSGVRP